MKIRLLVYGIVILQMLLFGCNRNSKQTKNRSFCYWRTTYQVDSVEMAVQNKLAVNHLYIRYFDLDWNSAFDQAVPVGMVNFESPAFYNQSDITPCVFITNTVFQKCEKKDLDELAGKVYLQIEHLTDDYVSRYVNYYMDSIRAVTDHTYEQYDSLENIASTSVRKNFDDVLMDCDWTQSTKANYFYFLECLNKNLEHKKLGVTLRLWQFKNRKQAGIPMVDRCLLMCYNLQHPRDFNTYNSIATAQALEPYLNEPEYPVALDIALPIFSWAVWFRDKKFKGILSDVNNATIDNNPKLFTLLADNHYRFMVDTVIGNTYLRYGDEMRVEQISKDELNNIVKLIASKIDLNDNARITFFSFDTTYINYYGHQKIIDFYNAFN